MQKETCQVQLWEQAELYPTSACPQLGTLTTAVSGTTAWPSQSQLHNEDIAKMG